jgi:hypothetical protein
MDKMCCETCKWAKWELTPTGKIRKFVAGRCLFPVDKEAIREFLRVHLPQYAGGEEQLRDASLFDVRRGIWPSDGESCGVWEAKE